MAFDRQNQFSGLRPVDETDIELAALEACMAGHVDGFEGLEVAQFKGGQFAWAYARKAGA